MIMSMADEKNIQQELYMNLKVLQVNKTRLNF